MRQVLLSVSDKTGLAEFARSLAELGTILISTGGTAKMLTEAGISSLPVEKITGFPEMFDGRVKTLHPKVHGGLLYVRNSAHEAKAHEHGIQPIDLLVVNFYPFSQTVRKPNVQYHEVIENIDIGGPAMVRSAAKNHASVTVIVDPADYTEVLDVMKQNGGETTLELRKHLAGKAYEATAAYDTAIAEWFKIYNKGGNGTHEGKIVPRGTNVRQAVTT